MVKNKMRPMHPGEVLGDELELRGLSRAELARALHVPANRITAILNGQRAITADTALRLARFFGTSPEMWMVMQAAYEIRIAEDNVGNKIARTVMQAL